jgi:hypothetical protein
MRSSALSRPKFPLRSPVAFSHTYPPKKKTNKQTGRPWIFLNPGMYVWINIQSV